MKAGNELGPLISTYRPKQPTWWSRIFLFFLYTLAVMLPLGYGLFRLYFDYTHYGPVAAVDWNWPWFLLALISLFLSICLGYLRRRRFHRFIAVHQNGLRYQLARPVQLLWGQIDGISTDFTREYSLFFPRRIHYQMVLYPKSGNPVQVKEPFKDFPELVTRIKARIYPRLSLTLNAGFQTGECLHFGPITVQNGWIQFKNRKFPWSQVSRVTVRLGDLMVELISHSIYRIPVSKIPNLEILCELIDAGVNA